MTAIYDYYTSLSPVSQAIVRRSCFAAYGLMTMPVTILIHEGGHALALKALFERVNTQISLIDYGYSGGLCYPNITKLSLTSLGKALNERTIVTLVAAAGPLAQITSVIGLLALGYLSDSFEDACALAFTSSLSLTRYSLSPLMRTEDPLCRSDFSKIWTFGGPRVYGASVLTIGTVTISMAYKILNSLFQTQKPFTNKQILWLLIVVLLFLAMIIILCKEVKKELKQEATEQSASIASAALHSRTESAQQGH